MIYIGIDAHKKYSYCTAIDEDGQILHEARIDGNDEHLFAEFIRIAGGQKGCRAVVETSSVWMIIYDIWEELPGVEEVVLAHAYKTRIIAEAQIKIVACGDLRCGYALKGAAAAALAVTRSTPGSSRSCSAPT